MKRLWLFIALSVLAGSCAGMPAITSGLGDDPNIRTACTIPFLISKYKMIHSITASASGGPTGAIIGITVADPAVRSVHAVIMTIEGLVIFEAEYQTRLTIIRGLPPFDSPDFARGLMDDIILTFMPPNEKTIETGILQNGSYICRYTDKESVTDIVYASGNGWTINRYINGRLNKSIILSKEEKHGQRKEITIIGKKPWKYTMTLELLEAEQVP